mgnify:FL=1
MGLLEGQKMSSSKGNVVLVKEALREYGADVTRLFLMGNAEPWMDFDWRESQVESTKKKLEQFKRIINDAGEHAVERRETDVDRWITSRLNRHILEANEALEGFETRRALQSVFYGLLKDWNWYLRRTTPSKIVASSLFEKWVRLLAPFTPYTCERLWREMGGKGLVADSMYPLADEDLIDEDVEAGENLLKSVMDDLNSILKVAKTDCRKIHLYIAPRWKHKVYEAILEGKTVKDVMADEEVRANGNQAARLMQSRVDEIPARILSVSQQEEYLSQAKEFIGNEYDSEVLTHTDDSYDPAGKYAQALPMKPGIYIE